MHTRDEALKGVVRIWGLNSLTYQRKERKKKSLQCKEQIGVSGDKKVCDNVCPHRYEWSSCLVFFRAKNCPQMEIYGSRFTLSLPPGIRPSPKKEFMAVLISLKCLLLVKESSRKASLCIY